MCKIPLDAITRQDVVKVRFFAEGGAAPKDQELRPTVQSLPRPAFAFSYQIVDNRPGNGDGQVQRGEGVTLHLTVKNVGPGKSYETQANIRNTGDGLYLRAGRFELPSMNPGDVREGPSFDVLDGLTDNFAKVEMSMADRDLRSCPAEGGDPVTRSNVFVNQAAGKVTVERQLGARPTAGAPVVDRWPGLRLDRLGTFGSFTKVRIDGTALASSNRGRQDGVGGKIGFKPRPTRRP
jgi:carboxyl-terminal processing protease